MFNEQYLDDRRVCASTCQAAGVAFYENVRGLRRELYSDMQEAHKMLECSATTDLPYLTRQIVLDDVRIEVSSSIDTSTPGSQHAAEPSNTPPLPDPDADAVPGTVGSGAFDNLPEVRGVAVTPRRAIATLVPALAVPHLAAVVTLAYSLRQTGNALPLILFYIEGGELSPVARETVERAGWQLRPLKRVTPFKKTAPRFTDACASVHLSFLTAA